MAGGALWGVLGLVMWRVAGGAMWGALGLAGGAVWEWFLCPSGWDGDGGPLAHFTH